MRRHHPQPESASLRSRAQAQLTGGLGPLSPNVGQGAAAALRVLYDLASDPDTAADALALLHELQVHQVELDLQSEELRASTLTLEATLSRQVQLYDCMPVSMMTIDADTRILEINLTGAQRLGRDREMLIGQRLDGFLPSASTKTLRTLMHAMDDGQDHPAHSLSLNRDKAPADVIMATVSVDPVGHRFLVALSDFPNQA